jgi:hypothetical protein
MADTQIPQESLEALERESEQGTTAVALESADVGEKELEEQALASNLDEAEGLEEALPSEPDEDEDALEEEPEIGQEAARVFSDESGSFFIGKQFTLPAFERWFAAQNVGSQPYNGIGIHHTYRPTGSQFVGPRTVRGVFDYYAREHGWTRGKGPHLWLYGGDNPDYHPGKILVVVGTHPRHDGIGISYRNHRWIHIECFGDFDAKRMPEGCVEGFRFLLRVLSEKRGQPVKVSRGPSQNGPGTWQGALFHRDAKTNPKTCPGKTTTHDWFDRAMTR